MRTLRFALLTIILAALCWIPLRGELNCSGGQCPPFSFDAANILALKNGANAQEFRIYNAAAGPYYTRIYSTSNTAFIYDTAGSAGANVFFRVNANNGWVLNTNGLWAPESDNAQDVGNASGQRVHSGFFGTGITVGVQATSSATFTPTGIGFRSNAMLSDGTPTCSGGGCVVTANSVNSVGSVTTTTTGSADITITFSAVFQHAPVCLGDNATTGNLLRATQELVGSFHLQGITASGDTLGYICLGN